MVLAGRAIYGEEIQAPAPAHGGATDCASARSPGQRAQRRRARRRIATASSGDVKLARPMKIVVDSGNGIAGASAPGILRALGCEVIELFCEVDGNFPNHHPDPSKPENLQDLIAAIAHAPAPNSASPSTATATASASSRAAARSSIPTAS